MLWSRFFSSLITWWNRKNGKDFALSSLVKEGNCLPWFFERFTWDVGFTCKIRGPWFGGPFHSKGPPLTLNRIQAKRGSHPKLLGEQTSEKKHHRCGRRMGIKDPLFLSLSLSIICIPPGKDRWLAKTTPIISLALSWPLTLLFATFWEWRSCSHLLSPRCPTYAWWSRWDGQFRVYTTYIQWIHQGWIVQKLSF